MNFNKDVFTKAFDAAIIQLEGAEKITKAVLLTLSRTVLEAHHETQDVGYINRLIQVLTPVNKKVAILFFEAFGGFKFDPAKQQFTSKNKKTYDACLAASVEFLEDPLNNIWSWAEREIAIEPKDFDLARMKKQVESLLKKVDDNKIPQMAVLEAMMEAGLSMNTLIALMAKIEGKEHA